MLTTAEVILLFAGVPLLVTLSIAGVVYAVERRNDSHSARRSGGSVTAGLRADSGVVDITAEVGRCWVHTDERGREVHHDDEPENVAGGVDRLARPCWTLRCAECGEPYRESEQLVHFTGPTQAVDIARASGWHLAGRRMRCRDCP